MKKIIMIAALTVAGFGIANAQGYNRIGLSYNNTQYNWGGDADDDDENFKLNGFGIDYIHGFRVSRALPMYVELGANVNFNFGNVLNEEEGNYSAKVKMQDINLQVPVNYTYKFAIADFFSIAPYAGINFKLHLSSRTKAEYKEHGVKGETDWVDLFSKDDMDDDTWNRFQMGWQIGVNFQYTKFNVGFQYGTDFIPAYSYKEDGYKERLNTGNLKITLGYVF